MDRGGRDSRSPFILEDPRRGVPVFRWDVWVPLLLHYYPGYRLRDLLEATVTEIGLLLGGIQWIQRMAARESPFRKKGQAPRIPPPIEYYYPRSEEGRGKDRKQEESGPDQVRW